MITIIRMVYVVKELVDMTDILTVHVQSNSFTNEYLMTYISFI